MFGSSEVELDNLLKSMFKFITQEEPKLGDYGSLITKSSCIALSLLFYTQTLT